MKALLLKLMVISFMIVSCLSCSNDNTPKLSDFRGIVKGKEVDIPSKTDGTIKNIFLKEGDRVMFDSTLFALEDDELLKELKLSRAYLLKSQKDLERLLNGFRKEEIKAWGERVEKAIIKFKGRLRDFERAELLFTDGVIREEEFDDASEALLISKAELGEAKSILAKLENGYTTSEIALAEAEVKIQKANVDLWKERLNKTIVRAKMNGMILHKNYEMGEWVRKGESIITIVDLNDVWVEVFIYQKHLSQIIGRKPIIKVDAFPNNVFTGKIEFIADKAEIPAEIYQTPEEQAELLFRVKVHIFNPMEKVRPGMTAEVIFGKEVNLK